VAYFAHAQPQQVPILKIINPTLTGNKWALFDEQSTNVQVSGSSNQSIKPANSNSWWDSPAIFDVNTCLITQWNSYTGRYRIKALPPQGITYEVQFPKIYNITKICIYTQINNGTDSLQFASGTPFNYSHFATVKNEATSGTWYDLNTNVTTEWLRITVGENWGYLNEIVFYGTVNQNITQPPPVFKKTIAKPVDSIIATNIFFGMGRSGDGNYYDEGWSGGMRYYMAAAYLQYANGSLKHPSGTASDVEYLNGVRLKNSGSNVHFCFGSLVDSSMVSASNNSGGDWADQKPIPSAYANENTWQRFNYATQTVDTGIGTGILTMNEIADDPSSYDRAAWSLRKYAIGGRQYLNLTAIEPDNEKDGPFKKAGYFYPYQIAAAMSAYYDGHGGQITYNGDSVGVWGTGVKLIFPALSYINSDYIESILHWWKYNRPVGFKPCPVDIFNVHSYPSTLEVQWTGQGHAVNPENTIYNLEKKLDTSLYYATLMDAGLYNTELGFDAYLDNRKTSSFTAIYPFGGKNEEQIQADWIIRSYLLHAARGISMYQYWLGDQGRYSNTSGTFNASGFLKWDSEANWLPVYEKRPAWYHLQAFKNNLINYVFKQEVRQDSLRMQLYINSKDSTQRAWIIWMASSSGSVNDVYLNLPSSYKMVTLSDNNPNGIIQNGTGNLQFTATESPKIILFKQPPKIPAYKKYVLKRKYSVWKFVINIVNP